MKYLGVEVGGWKRWETRWWHTKRTWFSSCWSGWQWALLCHLEPHVHIFKPKRPSIWHLMLLLKCYYAFILQHGSIYGHQTMIINCQYSGMYDTNSLVLIYILIDEKRVSFSTTASLWALFLVEHFLLFQKEYC